jgi:hypothetical protein
VDAARGISMAACVENHTFGFELPAGGPRVLRHSRSRSAPSRAVATIRRQDAVGTVDFRQGVFVVRYSKWMVALEGRALDGPASTSDLAVSVGSEQRVIGEV